jgi:hypothetical protein
MKYPRVRSAIPLLAVLALLAPVARADDFSSTGFDTGWTKHGASGQVYVWQSGTC